MKTKTITFVKEKDTKHMVRFVEKPKEGEPPVMNNVYLAKWFCGDATSCEVEVRLP